MTEYIYGERELGTTIAQILGAIEKLKPASTLLVAQPAYLHSRTHELTVYGHSVTAITRENVARVMEDRKPGVYIVSYNSLHLLDGMFPFFEAVVYDLPAGKSMKFDDARPLRLVRPHTKFVLSFIPLDFRFDASGYDYLQFNVNSRPVTQVMCAKHPDRVAVVRRHSMSDDELGGNVPMCHECFVDYPDELETWPVNTLRVDRRRQ